MPAAGLKDHSAEGVVLGVTHVTFLQDLNTLQQHRHILPDGAQLEVLEIGSSNGTLEHSQPPLLFLHGASHGAWCWEVSLLSSTIVQVLPKA